MENHQAITNPPRVAALEKIPAAARRMGVSISQAYREIKSGRLSPLVKLGERASAVPAEAVDAWINERIAAATRLADQKGGR
jgi:predicted DNA-binding transcriptional regulator AlpA